MKVPSPPFHARLSFWALSAVAVIYGTRALGGWERSWSALDLIGLICVPVVLSALLTLRVLVHRALSRAPDLFVGRRRVLSGAASWFGPPLLGLALVGLNEAGIVSYRYTHAHHEHSIDLQSVTTLSVSGDTVRMVRPDATTFVTSPEFASYEKEKGARVWSPNDDGSDGISVTAESGNHVTAGFRDGLPAMALDGCTISGTIAVSAPSPFVLGVLRCSTELHATVEFDLVVALPDGKDGSLRGTAQIDAEGRMVGFGSTRAFLRGLGRSMGGQLGQALLTSAQDLRDRLAR